MESFPAGPFPPNMKRAFSPLLMEGRKKEVTMQEDCFNTYEKKEIPYERFRVSIRPEHIYGFEDPVIADKVFAYVHCYTGDSNNPDYNPDAKDWIEIRTVGPVADERPSSKWIQETEEHQKCRVFCLGYVKPHVLKRLMMEYKMDVKNSKSFFTAEEDVFLFHGTPERLKKIEEEFLRFVMNNHILPGFHASYRMARAIMNGETDEPFKPYVFNDNTSLISIRNDWEFETFKKLYKPSIKEFVEILDKTVPIKAPEEDSMETYSDVNSIYASLQEGWNGCRLFIAESVESSQSLSEDIVELGSNDVQEYFVDCLENLSCNPQSADTPLKKWFIHQLSSESTIPISKACDLLWSSLRDKYIRIKAEELSRSWDEIMYSRIFPRR